MKTQKKRSGTSGDVRFDLLLRFSIVVFPLPNAHHVLHQQAHGGDAGPAHGAQSDWLSTGFYQFHQVAVQTDGGHGHGDEEFAQFLQRGKDFRRDTRHARKGCDY